MGPTSSGNAFDIWKKKKTGHHSMRSDVSGKIFTSCDFFCRFPIVDTFSSMWHEFWKNFIFGQIFIIFGEGTQQQGSLPATV